MRRIGSVSLVGLTALAAAVVFASSPATAVSPKKNSPYDYRIKSVVYNPLDTVELNAVLGIQIHITVGKDEKYVTHAFGDTKAWQFTHSGNNFFIRPTADLSDTNLTIVTDKHTYNILLHFIGHYTKQGTDGQPVRAFINNPWSMKQATIELNYQYPNEDAAKARAEIAKAKLKGAMARTDPNASFNIDYQMSADPASASIAPVNVWDDFRFTYFKFAANAELPEVFVISSDGKESTVNTHVEGADHHIIVAEATAKEWRVRYGQQKVIGVVNGAFDATRGATPSGTIVPGFRRVMKNEDEQ
ncbi:TrbG/VirB9 family P-type conjugative transfer protein [Caballeronia zhejiangensis]|uniref:TrbG/VirB9 family P-type conjugative transfer protein n=1 Tax=Caballeronia zhejiangensis TaxID=871203 RepID=UPI0015898D9D|nr:TrbG/VirB9 family P-type conjugative transfer protein [Caballeronia zhejiangensis]